MKKLLLLVFSVITFSACDNSDDRICTEEFRMIIVSIRNNAHQPDALDSTYTVRQASGEKIRPEQTMGAGLYVVLDDNFQPTLKNKEEDFRFIGWKNNAVIVDQPYRIGADNCHIYKKTGADSLMLQ